MCLKCVLGPQEPIKKFSRVIFFLLSRSVNHTFVMGWVKKIYKKIDVFKMCFRTSGTPKKILTSNIFLLLRRKMACF